MDTNETRIAGVVLLLVAAVIAVAALPWPADLVVGAVALLLAILLAFRMARGR